MAETVGDQLKKARLDRGLTLLEASHQTRIRPHYLEALENDRRDLLPSLVQGRGFLRLYADFLRLPAAALVDTWDFSSSVSTHASPPQEPEPSVHIDAAEEENGRDTPRGEYERESAPPVTSDLSSEIILVEIGRKLRRQRESLNLKITDIERFTHLRQKYIEALEKGDIDDLPSPVQGRGMLSNYARFLNMDDEAILLRFADALQTRRLERSTPKPSPGIFSRRPARQKKGLVRLLTPDLVISSLVIISLFGFAIWSVAQVSAIQQDMAPEPSLIAISNLMLTVSPQPEGEIAPQQSSATPEPPQLAAFSEAAEPEIEMTSTLPTLGDAPLQLYIIAKQRAFLRVVSDNKEVFNGRVMPGGAYPFSAKEQIELTTGNAAALQVFYNQSDLGTLGSIGQVVNLIFVPGGLTTPTPSASATPTPTLPSTATSMPSPTVPSPTITIFVP
jgi:cytoskeleton protein RodZ